MICTYRVIQHYQQIHLKTYKKKRVKTYEHDTAHFLSALGLAWKARLEKTKVELELSTDIDMLEMVEKGITLHKK